jgi:hypothetical protein
MDLPNLHPAIARIIPCDMPLSVWTPLGIGPELSPIDPQFIAERYGGV